MKIKRIVRISGLIALVALLCACHDKQETAADIRPVRTAVVEMGYMATMLPTRVKFARATSLIWGSRLLAS